jgi:hypothetical protein
MSETGPGQLRVVKCSQATKFTLLSGNPKPDTKGPCAKTSGGGGGGGGAAAGMCLSRQYWATSEIGIWMTRAHITTKTRHMCNLATPASVFFCAPNTWAATHPFAFASRRQQYRAIHLCSQGAEPRLWSMLRRKRTLQRKSTCQPRHPRPPMQVGSSPRSTQDADFGCAV